MKHLKKFNESIGYIQKAIPIQVNETLRSDEIEIVCKKLSNFFDGFGFYKKKGWGDVVEDPNYQIYSDRDSIKRSIEEYKNPSKTFKSIVKKHKASIPKILKSYEDQLENFKYGDIAIFTSKNSNEISKKLFHLIDTMGYFISGLGSESMKNIKNDKSKILQELSMQEKICVFIEPKYDSEVNFQEEYVYHTTDKKNLGKIMRIGLIPKTKNTRSFYPERIYLSPNIEYNNSIKNQLGTDKSGEYVDLKIKKFPGLKLYKDVRFKGGFYTYTNIPPKYIEII